MSMETPAHACAALAALVVGADEIGTMEERRFLFESMSSLPVFDELDESGFHTLVAETTEWVWSTFPTQGSRVTDDGVADLLRRVRGVLPAESRTEIVRAVVGLARADGLELAEERLLLRMCDELEVDRSLAGESPGSEPD